MHKLDYKLPFIEEKQMNTMLTVGLVSGLHTNILTTSIQGSNRVKASGAEKGGLGERQSGPPKAPIGFQGPFAGGPPPHAKYFLTRFRLITKMTKFDLPGADLSLQAEKLEP